MNEYIQKHIINLRLTTDEVSVEELGKATISDQVKIYEDARKSTIIKEFFILQKCNCVELYFVVDNNSKPVIDSLVVFWTKHSSLTKTLIGKIVKTENFQAALHLIKVATSLESLLLGDAQVLGQLRKAKEVAKKKKTLGPVMDSLLKFANTAGSRTRTETKLCAGNVSVPRLVLEIMTPLFAREKGKILVVGTGKMGKLITELLANIASGTYLFLTNRTKEKAETLAAKLNTHTIDFSSYKHYLKEFRYIIFTVAVQTYQLNEKEARQYLGGQRTTLIDVSNPPCVDPKVGLNKEYELLDLTYIQNVGAKNFNQRKQEISKVNKIVDEEFTRFKSAFKILGLEILISDIYKDVYMQTINYVNKQKKELGDLIENEKVNYLIRGIISRSLLPVANIRALATKDIEAAYKIAQYLKEVRHETLL